jgi:hypothetical protein
MAVVLIKPATANYTYNHTNITSNQNYELEVTQAGTTVVKKFTSKSGLFQLQCLPVY